MKGPKVVNAGSRATSREPARWVYGINAVLRRLTVRPETVHEIRILAHRSSRLRAVAELAARHEIPSRDADEGALRQMTGTRQHQGLAALTDPFEYSELDTVLADRRDPLLVIDQIQDPQNLGALLRTAAATGVAAAILPRDGAVGITAVVEKAAAGAVNDLAVCRVTNVSRLLHRLRELGIWTLALVPHGGEDLFTVAIPRPVALVVGGEAGLRPLVEKSCDLRASIPVRDPVESLNASVAGAIGMYEIVRRAR